MRIIPIQELYNYNYSINVINSLKQYWKSTKKFNCINFPKQTNILLYLDNCNAEYILKNGEKISAKSGEIVYCPINCEYNVQFYNFKDENSNTIGVNFHLLDENNDPFVLSDNILIFKPAIEYKLLFSKINKNSESAVVCYGKMKSGMYDIISKLSASPRAEKLQKFDVIAKGIVYIEENPELNLSIAEIAKMCNVSESHFRRLFREYSGFSPISYITKHKIEQAKTYLVYGILNMNEIAEHLGFTDAAYFSKIFKAEVGMTPTEYKNRTH